MDVFSLNIYMLSCQWAQPYWQPRCLCREYACMSVTSDNVTFFDDSRVPSGLPIKCGIFSLKMWEFNIALNHI